MDRRTALIGFAIVPAFAVSCGTRTIDTSRAERTIQSGIQKATGEKVTASCPSDVPVEKGRVTLCRVAAADGTKATVRVLQTDNNGHASYSSPLVHTTQLEQQIAASATRKLGFPVKVICPDLVEATRGRMFQCRAVDLSGDSAPVAVTAKSAQGGFHYDIARPSSSA